MSKIAFLGLGAMGSRMAPHLIKAGHDVTVWNRSPAAVTAAVARGARSAATPREAAEGAEFVFSMLTDDDASKAVSPHQAWPKRRRCVMALCRVPISSSRRARWAWIADRCPGSTTQASSGLFLPARGSSRTSSAASATATQPRCFRATRGFLSRKPDISNKAKDLTMPATDIEKVVNALQGFASRDADFATRHVNPSKFIQHNPFVADGIAGLKDEISQLPGENHHLEVVRVFRGGPYVFTQTEGVVGGQSVFFDIFRFEDGLMVEHWVFSAPAATPNQSGHTQTDGPTEARHFQDTDKNKSIVREYYDTVHIAGDHSKIPQYFSGDFCIRHEPGVKDGVAAFTRDVAALMQHRTIDELKFLLGQGDFVFIAAKGTHEDEPCVYTDLYRIEGEKIVEHWGFPARIPPQEEWKNHNGIL